MTPKNINPAELAGYEVVVAVCGGIAAYKVCHVVSSLVQRGAGVTVAMTDSATHFVGPATFQALTGRRVLRDLFDAAGAYDPQHIRLTRGADLFLIAPATANIIGKIANGICDDLVSTMVAAAGDRVMLAPAMNDVMWAHQPIQDNIAKLRTLGYAIVGPAEGWLACRSIGPGRMSESDDILSAAVDALRSARPRGASVPAS